MMMDFYEPEPSESHPWLATRFMPSRGCEDYEGVVKKAKGICISLGINEEEHFQEHPRIKCGVSIIDYRLSIYACQLCECIVYVEQFPLRPFPLLNLLNLI